MTFQELTYTQKTKIREWLNNNPTVLDYMRRVGIEIEDMVFFNKDTLFQDDTQKSSVKVIAADENIHRITVSMPNGVRLTIGSVKNII